MWFYRRLLFGLYKSEIVMKAYWIIIAATYVVSQVVVFTECQPFRVYWDIIWVSTEEITPGMRDLFLTTVKTIKTGTNITSKASALTL
jgi:hypothetical protein